MTSGRSIARHESVLPALAAIFMAGAGMVFPLLPLLSRDRGVTYSGVGLILLGYGLGKIASDIAAGPFIDRFGLARAGLTGTALVAAGSVATAASPSLLLICLSWTTVGVGSGLVIVTLYATLLVSSTTSRIGRTLGAFYSGMNIGLIIGAVLGGALAGALGITSVLYAQAVLAGACFLLFVFAPLWLPVHHAANPSVGSATGYTGVLTKLGRATMQGSRRYTVITVLLVQAATMFAVGAVFDTALPLFAREELHLSLFEITGIYAVFAVTELAVMYPLGLVVDRVGPRELLIGSIAASVIFIPMLSLTGNFHQLIVIAALVGIATGAAAVPPIAMLRMGLDQGSVSASSGLFVLVGDLGFLVGPVAAALVIHTLGFTFAFVLGVGPLLLALVIAARERQVFALSPWNAQGRVGPP